MQPGIRGALTPGRRIRLQQEQSLSAEPLAEEPACAELSTGQRIRGLEIEGYVSAAGDPANGIPDAVMR